MKRARVLIPGKRLFDDLYFCGGGKSVCMSGHSFGPDVRMNYLIHYIISGKGIFETDKMTYHLCQGEGFLIEPNVSTFYQADETEPWSYLWISFNGQIASRILKDLDLCREHPVFSCEKGDDLEAVLSRLFNASESESSLFQHGQLLAFLHVLAQKPHNLRNLNTLGSKANYHTDRALAFIRANYSHGIQISDIAHYLGISRNYLFSLFQENIGQSPQEYLSNFCLGCARELLTTTTYSIGEIAQLCGYRNIGVFTSAFKRKYSISPSLYQKYNHTHPEINPTELAKRNQENET